MTANTAPPSVQQLEAIYAAVGRALVLAVRYEKNCEALARWVGIIEQVHESGLSILEDADAAHKIFDSISQRRALRRHITTMLKLPGVSSLEEPLQRGREARNELVHSLLSLHDLFASNREYASSWLLSTWTQLRDIAREIAVANGIAGTLLEILHNDGEPPEDFTPVAPKTVAEWVLGKSYGGDNATVRS